MQSLNYFSGIVKILESPKQTLFNDKYYIVEFRALMPQSRKNRKSKVISLVFWNSLKRDLKNYYQMNDYILIEGYVSIKISNNNNDLINRNLKKVTITVLKVYPFLLKPRNLIKKI